MENISDILPFIEGSISVFNLFIWLQLTNIRTEVEREKKYFLNFANQEKENNQDLNTRLRNIEMELSRRWSTWGK